MFGEACSPTPSLGSGLDKKNLCFQIASNSTSRWPMNLLVGILPGPIAQMCVGHTSSHIWLQWQRKRWHARLVKLCHQAKKLRTNAPSLSCITTMWASYGLDICITTIWGNFELNRNNLREIWSYIVGLGIGSLDLTDSHPVNWLNWLDNQSFDLSK